MSGLRTPTLSVVIPVHNRPDLLERALQSVRAQSVGNIEIIVVDDASDEPFALDGADVRVIRNASSLGAQGARLVGVEAATGTYVGLLDSDDWWHPEKAARQLAVLHDRAGVVLSCRVVATRGTLRRAAPWRPLAPNERVEEFLYVHRGMLQTSTVMAARATLADLLRSSLEARVHNDTMLFLEAQRRGLAIVQLPEALSHFDDDPRPDRVSYDRTRVQASEAWFRAVSSGWSPAARRGFMLTDMVTRYVNTGQRWRAATCLIRAYHPRLSFVQYLKKTAYVLFNGSPFTRFRLSNR